MEKDNKKLELLTDKILQNKADDELSSLINRISVSPEIMIIGEEMRQSIFSDINTRINKLPHRFWRVKVGIAAASVIILLGITNYLSYNSGYNQQNNQIVEIKSPLGIQSAITLPDGTKVSLNSGTTLSYPTKFISKNREVKVDGEAYFDVAKDLKHPFIVNTDNINIRVLGTKFNVKAYQDENSIDITLEEGCVEVGSDMSENYHQIEPGQQIRFNKNKSVFTKSKINTIYFTSWKEGIFYFNKNSFEEIAIQLERRFNVNIQIESDKLKHIIYSGDFIRGENLEQILKVMTTDKRSKYTIDGDQVKIYE